MLLKIDEYTGIEFDETEYFGQLVIEFYDEENPAHVEFNSIADVEKFANLLLDATAYMKRTKMKTTKKGTLHD